MTSNLEREESISSLVNKIRLGWELKKLSGTAHTSDRLSQHFEEIAKDHQNGVFVGTNDLVQKIGGKRPTGLPEFLEANKTALVA